MPLWAALALLLTLLHWAPEASASHGSPHVVAEVAGGSDTDGDGIPDSITVTAGDTVTVNLRLTGWDDPDGLFSYQWKVLYNPALLTVDSVSHGNIFTPGSPFPFCPFATGPEIDNVGGSVTFGCLDTGAPPLLPISISDAILDTINFTAAGSGTAPIDVLCNNSAVGGGTDDISGAACDIALGTLLLDGTAGGGFSTDEDDIYGDGVFDIGGGGTAPGEGLLLVDGSLAVSGVAVDRGQDGADNGPGAANANQEDQDNDGLGGTTVVGFLATLAPSLNIGVTDPTAVIDDSTVVLAAFADEDGKPLANVDVTCKIEQQPGTDANLEGKTEVTVTADAEGLAKTTLNTGSKTGSIVVACSAEDQTKRVTVNVVEAGPATGVGSLAPGASSIPAWAAIASGLGGTALLGSLGAIALRIMRRRR